MSDELQVDPQLLRDAADGINGIIGTLAEIGISETATAGRGFSAIAMTGIESGHVDVQKQLEEFAERWAWGVRTLVQNANHIAESLELAAGRYHLMDKTVEEMLSTSADHFIGNSHQNSDIQTAEQANAQIDRNLETIAGNAGAVAAVIP